MSYCLLPGSSGEGQTRGVHPCQHVVARHTRCLPHQAAHVGREGLWTVDQLVDLGCFDVRHSSQQGAEHRLWKQKSATVRSFVSDKYFYVLIIQIGAFRFRKACCYAKVTPPGEFSRGILVACCCGSGLAENLCPPHEVDESYDDLSACISNYYHEAKDKRLKNTCVLRHMYNDICHAKTKTINKGIHFE